MNILETTDKNALRNIKHWCAVMRPKSPGDLFRLIHGIATKFPEEERVGLLCPRSLVTSLQEVWSIKNIYLLPLNNLSDKESEYKATEVYEAWKNDFGENPAATDFSFEAKEIWTSYSNHRQQGCKDLSDKGVYFKKIDCYANNPTFLNSIFSTSIHNDSVSKDRKIKIAVVLRIDSEIHPWRDSPTHHFAPNFWHQFNADITYAGLPNSSDYPDKTFPNIPFEEENLSLKDQLEKAGNFDLAVGVNSSALDIFAAAGCWVIREAVFQGHARWPFGWDFNHFLGVRPNIELKIDRNFHKTTSWANEERSTKVVQIVLKKIATNIDTKKHLVKGFMQTSTEPGEVGKWLDSIVR